MCLIESFHLWYEWYELIHQLWFYETLMMHWSSFFFFLYANIEKQKNNKKYFQCKSNEKLQKYVYFLEYKNNKSKIVFIWCEQFKLART